MKYIGECLMHSSLAINRHGRGGYGADGRYQSPGFQGVSGLPFAKICQGVLAYSLILNQMKRVALSNIAFVEAFVHMCVSVCVCVCV